MSDDLRGADRALLLQNARVFEGTGPLLIERGWVLIQGERIAGVGSGEAPVPESAGAIVLDMTGYTVLPGLINLHVHFHLDGSGDTWGRAERETDQLLSLRSVRVAERMIRSGITAVRDLGAKGHGIIALRDAIDEDLFLGPRIQAAGQAICMTGGHFRVGGSRQVDGVPQMLHAVREQIASGADVIKFMATSGMTAAPGVPLGAAELTLEELRAGADVAHARGRPVAAHALGTDGIKTAARAGVDTIEHAPFLDDEGIELLRDRGTVLVPTLTAYHRMAEHAGEGALPVRVARMAEEVHHGHLNVIGRAFRAGLKIGVGTDAGSHFNPHDDIVTELEMLVEAGIPVADVLQMVSRISADALGWGSRIGTVEPGKLADLIAVQGNPIQNLAVLRSIDYVLKAGEIVIAPESRRRGM